MLYTLYYDALLIKLYFELMKTLLLELMKFLLR